MNIKKVSVVGSVIVAALVAYLLWQYFVKADTEGLVSGNGRIEATEINLASKLSGQLTDIFVKEGDYVTPGQVLAKVKISTIEAQLREAQAQKRQAESEILTAEADVAMKKSDKAAAEAVVVQRETELIAAKRRLARTETLAKDGAASKQQLDDDIASMLQAEASHSAAKADVASEHSAIVSHQTKVTNAHTQVDAAQATIERLQYDIEDGDLKAPLKARVQYRVAQPGEMIAEGGRVLNLVDLSDVYMTFFLPETVAGSVAIGTEVRVVLDAISKVYIPAKVTFVADTAQFTPKSVETESERQKLMFRVKAKIDADLLLKNIEQVKTGLPGVAYIKIDSKAEWPAFLSNKAK